MLTTAGLLVEAGVILKKGAAQVTAADFSQVERVARELCAGSLGRQAIACLDDVPAARLGLDVGRAPPEVPRPREAEADRGHGRLAAR